MSRQPPRHTPAPSPLAVACSKALGFSFVEVLLGLGVATILGVGTFSVAQSLNTKKQLRSEQANIQQIAQRVGSAYSSTGRFPTNLRQDALSLNLLPQSMVNGTALESAWGASVDVQPRTIDARANAGLDIIYAAVPPRLCENLVVSAAKGMYDVRVNNQSVFNTEGNVDAFAAGTRCGATPSQVVFTYYAGATGLAITTPPALCAADPSNPLCFTPANPTPPTSSPVVVIPPPPAPPPPPGSPPPPPPPPSAPPPPVVTPPSAPPPPSSPPPSSPPPPFCVAPAPVVTPGSQSASCLPGRVTPAGSATFTQTRTQTTSYSCPDPWAPAVASIGAPTAWSPLETTACAPACMAPAPLNEARAGTPQTQPGSPATQAGPAETRTLACPPLQAGSITESRATTQTRTTTQFRNTTQTRTTVYACPAPTGAYTTTVGAWSAPGGPFGAWNAPNAPFGAWSTPTPTGAWVQTANTCTPTTTPPPPPPPCGPAPAPATRPLVCPPNQSGAITQTHGWTASPSPTCWVAAPWATTSNTCTPTGSPVTGGYEWWLFAANAAQDSSPCQTGALRQDEVRDLMDSATCDAANYGLEVGGDWCESGGPSIVGHDWWVCEYKVDIQSAGTITAGADSTTTETLLFPSGPCSTPFRAYTFDESITYDGVSYNVKGSCPSGSRFNTATNTRRCTVTATSPGGAGIAPYFNTGSPSDIDVSWTLTPPIHAGTSISRVRFTATTNHTTGGCAFNPSGSGIQRISVDWSHRESGGQGW